MEYVKYNFKIYQGADKYIPFSFYSLVENTKTNLDFTGSDFLMTIKSSYNSNNIIDQLSLSNKRIKLGIIGTNGFEESTTSPYAIEIYFPHEVTSEYNIPEMVYDLFRLVGNKHELLLHGNITLIKGVSYE